MRKLVTVRKVKDILPIKDADRIERAVIDGWKCVVAKGEFDVGDYGLYFEIDSFLPVGDSRFSFLKKDGTQTIGDFEGIRVRTRKFRGEISQGLLLPLAKFPEVEKHISSNNLTVESVYIDRIDFTDMVGVVKYERPEPQTPDAAGNFPPILRMTDEERIQNIYDEISVENKDVMYYPTLKLDGTSCTIAALPESYLGMFNSSKDACRTFEFNGQTIYIVVCSRTLQIKTSSESHYVSALERADMFFNIEELYKHFRRPIAVSGEIIGPGIQGNQEKLMNHQFYAFNLYDVKLSEYFSYSVTKDAFDSFRVQSVPMITKPFKPFEAFESIDELLEFSDGPSMKADKREGIVYKSDYHGSFKAISNQWLQEKGNA